MVMICRNNNRPLSSMLRFKFNGNRPAGSNEDLQRVFKYKK